MGLGLKIYNNTYVPLMNYLFLKKIKSKFAGKPIIIGGCGRSGTSMLLSILSSHKAIYGVPKETSYFSPTANTYHPDYWAKFNMKGFYSEWIEKVDTSEASCFCEKTPKNVRFFKRIEKLFRGEVKIIHIIRDARDVVLSTHPKNPKKSWASIDRWISDVSKGLEVSDSPNVYVVKYEDITANFEETIIDLFKFLELELTEDVLNWHKHSTVRKHGAWSGEVKPLHSDSISKWKKNLDNPIVDDVIKNKEAMSLLKQLDYIT